MAFVGSSTSAPPAPVGNNYGFNRLGKAQQEQARAAQTSSSPESVTMSPRARIESTFEQTGQNWKQLSIPEPQKLTGPERRALNNLNFLRDTARREDGGLSTTRDGKEVHVGAQGALNALRNGNSVNYYESAGDKPVPLHNFGEVADLTRDLRERIAQTQHAAGKK